MNKEDIVNKLNETYKGKYIFEITDDQNNIVGFVDDSSFKSVVAVIEPTVLEMDKLIAHIEKHTD